MKKLLVLLLTSAMGYAMQPISAPKVSTPELKKGQWRPAKAVIEPTELEKLQTEEKNLVAELNGLDQKGVLPRSSRVGKASAVSRREVVEKELREVRSQIHALKARE